MADFSKTCQKSVESVKQFLKEAEANTPEVDQRLKSLNDVVLILSSLIQDEVVDVDQEGLELARNLCKTLLFGDWMKLIMTMACHSSFFNEVETQQKADETSKLPSHMQKKVEEITEYLKKCRDILKSNDKIVHSLIEKVREAKRTNFKRISDEDIRTLRMDVEDLGCNLKMSKTYLDSAYRAFDQLKSQIDEEKWSHKVKVAAITTGFVAALTICGVVLKVGFPTAKQTGEAVEKISDFLGKLETAQLALLGFAGAIGAGSLGYLIYAYMHSFSEKFDKNLASVESDLQKAQTEYDAQKIQFKKKLKERMKL